MWPLALLAGAAGIGSAVIGARSADKAADAQKDASDAQIALQREIYDNQTKRFRPYNRAGRNALSAYEFELGLGDKPKGYQGFEATPGYDFRLQQGMDAVQGSAAASGGLFSGRSMKALNDYGQGMASQEYGNYLNRLGGMVDSGQGAAGLQATAGANFATGASNALASGGNARAAGYMGTANAVQGGIGNALSAYGYMQGVNAPKTGAAWPGANPMATGGLY